MLDYNKPPLSIEEQIKLLESRGLFIPDKSAAYKLLSTVSYYRFRGYTYPYQDNSGNDHPFHPNTSIEWIEYVYEFDRKLRLLVIDSLERIEIAFKTQLNLHLSLQYGPWWFTEESCFRNTHNHQADLEELHHQIERSSDKFIRHHRMKYGDSKLPPSWKTFEVASFGLTSKFFKNIHSTLQPKKDICHYFGLHSGGFRILESWLQHFSVIRNICAHHGRLWDRIVVQEPSYAAELEKPWISSFPDSRKRYAKLSLLVWLSRRITGTDSYKRKVIELLDTYDKISLVRMGFPTKWRNSPLWSYT